MWCNVDPKSSELSDLRGKYTKNPIFLGITSVELSVKMIRCKTLVKTFDVTQLFMKLVLFYGIMMHCQHTQSESSEPFLL